MEQPVLLGEVGLTSTSANYVANKAKEFISHLESLQFSFISTQVALIGSKDYQELSVGNTNLDNIEDSIKKIGKAKSLIAWLREGIKAKKELIENIVYPIPEPATPAVTYEWTESKEIDSLPIGDRFKYYEAQAFASAYGDFIHPHGSFSVARKNLANKINNPSELEGSGRDAVLYKYIPTMDLEKVDEVFFKLQESQRNWQATFNGISNTINNNVIKKNITIRENEQALYKKYHQDFVLYNSKKSLWMDQEIKRINDLKIVIPQSLTDIYNAVNKLGQLKT